MVLGIVSVLLIIGGSAVFAALAVAIDKLGDAVIAAMDGGTR